MRRAASRLPLQPEGMRLPCNEAPRMLFWTSRLPHVAGRARALAMYLNNDKLGAAEACAAGIVHEVSAPLQPWP